MTNSAFYSKSTGGFYTREIHGDNIPADAVEITTEEHAALIEGQSQGRLIQADAKGKPVLADPPAPTDEELASAVRSKRNALLSACDWTQVADAQVDQSAWREYRQTLRDVTAQPTFPHSVEWPVAPV